MKTSRKQGILVLKTDKTYDIAISGNIEKRNVIICKDINYENEGIAFDLEQSLMGAFMDASERFQKNRNDKNVLKITDETNKKNDEFLNKESPSEKEVDEQWMSLLMPILMSKSVKLKEVMSIFEQLCLSGLITCDANILMTISIWKTVNRSDKLKIAFSYMAFFVNPLQQLLKSSTLTIESQKD